MYKFPFLLLLATAYAAPTLVIDYNCTPNIACGIMTLALANKGNGLGGINDIDITSTQSLRRMAETNYACPEKYCQGLKDPAPGSNNGCFEYPFASTAKSSSNYKCVPRGELIVHEAALDSFYSSNGIKDGGEFYVRITGIQSTSCLNFYS